jgi:hypothetical protein
MDSHLLYFGAIVVMSVIFVFAGFLVAKWNATWSRTAYRAYHWLCNRVIVFGVGFLFTCGLSALVYAVFMFLFGVYL